MSVSHFTFVYVTFFCYTIIRTIALKFMPIPFQGDVIAHHSCMLALVLIPGIRSSYQTSSLYKHIYGFLLMRSEGRSSDGKQDQALLELFESVFVVSVFVYSTGNLSSQI